MFAAERPGSRGDIHRLEPITGVGHMIASFEPVSIIVPVYGGEKTLIELHRRLAKALEASCSDYEILFVDDAAPGNAWNVIDALAGGDRHVRGIRLAVNSGQHNAVLCGLRFARFQVAVTLDDDLQHPPEEIPRLLEALRSDIDLVYGVPRTSRHSGARNLMSVTYKHLTATILGTPQIASISALRALRVGLRDAFEDHHGPTTLFDSLLARAEPRWTVVHVAHAPREVGRSGYSALALVRHAALLWRSYRAAPVPRPQRECQNLLYEVAGITAIQTGVAVVPPSIRLRPLGLDDAPRMFEWMQDPTVRRGIALLRTPSLPFTRRWISEATVDEFRWVRAICESGHHVGNIVLDCEPERPNRARLSIYLGPPSARGRGVGQAAIDHGLEAGFSGLGLETIWLWVLCENTPAITLYQRSGFVLEPRAQVLPGLARSARGLAMSISKQRYLSRRTATIGAA